MLVQAVGLLVGIVFVAEVGDATTMPGLIVAMIGFGLCKGIYDAGIFASVFEFVRPSERASVAGLMNLLGWGGGALGPLAVGLLSTYGGGTTMDRMSHAIGWSGAAYAAAAALVLSAWRIYRVSPH
jgi:MFS family permease